MSESTTIPLSFDSKGLQKQLDEIGSMMNKAFGSFGGKGYFKNISSAMNSFKTSFGSINKSLIEVNRNLSVLVGSINSITSGLGLVDIKVQKIGKNIGTTKLDAVKEDIANVRQSLDKPVNLKVQLSETDIVKPLEAQLISARQKINEALKTGEVVSGGIDLSEFDKSARSMSDLFADIERTVKSKAQSVRGTIRDLVREERNSIEQFSSLFRQNVNILESIKATREPIKLQTMTGFEAGPIATMLEQVNQLRVVVKDVSLKDSFVISDIAINPLHELVKTLHTAGIELNNLKQLGRSFMIDVDGTKVDALEGSLKDLSKVAGTDVAKAFSKITNSKLVTQDVWSKVFEASDIVSFNKALVELESKLEKTGRKSKNVKAIHNNFAEIKQLAETHFAAKMSEEFEQGATKSERKIGGLYKTVTKLHSLIQAGKVSETALIKPYKLLSKELQNMLGDARNFDLALNKITASAREQQDIMEYRPKVKSIESAQQEMYGFRQGLQGVAAVDLNVVQTSLERVMVELRKSNSEVKLAQAMWVNWGEVSKKAVIDLRKVIGTFDVPIAEKVMPKYPDIEAAKIAQLKEYRAELEKLGAQRSEIIKKQQASLFETAPMEQAIPYKQIVNQLNEMTDAYKKQSIAILTKSQALQQSIDLEGRSATEKEIAQLNKLEKELVEVSSVEKKMSEATKTVFSTLDKLSKQEVFSREDIDSILQMTAEMEKFGSIAKNVRIVSGLEKIKTILRESVPESWPVKIKPNIDVINIDKQMGVLRKKIESFSIVPETPTKTIEVTAYETMKSTRRAMTSLNKQIVAMSKSAKIAIQNIKMDEALDPKAAIELMKPMEGLLREFDLVQQDLKLIDEALVKVGANPTEEVMKKTWSELEPVIKRTYKTMNALSGAYNTITKNSQEATSMVHSFSLQLSQLMRQPDKAAVAFKKLSNSLLQSISIADEVDLAKRLKSPNKQIRKDAEELTKIISSTQKKLSVVSKEAISLKPDSAEASVALNKWKDIIMKLVSSFGQGGVQAQQRFLDAYQSKAKGFKFDISLFTSSMKLEKVLKRLGMMYRTLGARSGDILPVGEFDQLIQRMSELEKMGALGTVATNPIIELKKVIEGTVNVFDKMKLAVKASAPPEVIQSIQKEIDTFLQLKKSARNASEENKQLGATQGNLGLLTELAIKYLSKETSKFQRLGKTAHIALSEVKSGMASQAGMFKAGLGEIEGPIFKLEPKGGFEFASELNAMFGKLYFNTSENINNLRKVTDKSLTGWSMGFKKGFNKADNVVKQNGSILSRNLNQIKKSILSASDFRWEQLLDPEGVEVMKKSALNAGLQIGDLQKKLARFRVGKERGVTSFPTIKALQTQLKTVLSISEEVERKIGKGELGVEHFPAVDRLNQYAVQLTSAIDMIQKPYESVKGLSKKEKVSSKSLGKAFRSGIYRASDQLKETVKQIRQPMRSTIVRLFEDVFSMEPTEIGKAGGMIRNLTERFPVQVKSALGELSKKGFDLSKYFSKMFKIDIKSFATVEQATAVLGAKIPKMLLKVLFPTEGQVKFATEAKKMAKQMISTPLNSALGSAIDVVSPDVGKFKIGEHMLREARFDGEKFVKIKSEYRGYILDLLKHITQVMRTSPTKTIRPILEKVFDPEDAKRVSAYSNAMKGVLSNLQAYLKKTLSGKLPKGQQMIELGAIEEMKAAGLDLMDEDIAQKFSKMYTQAGKSLNDFIVKEEKWSGDSIKDLMNLIEYWENLGQMIKLVTGKIPAVSGVKNISEIMFKKETLGVGAIDAGRSMATTMVQSLNTTLESGTGIKKPLAAMIGKDPSIIFEVLRSGSQKLKNELSSLGFKLRGSTSDMLKSINSLSGVRVDTAWFEKYRMENERFYFESKKTSVAIERIIQGLKLIKPGDTDALNNTIVRSEDLLKRASLSYESFMNGLYKHTSKFSTYGDKQKANINKFTNILAGGMRTIAQFYQEDPFEKGVTRLVRGEEFLWEKLIAVADKGGKKLKTSIQSELAKAIEPGKRESINLERLFKGTGKVPEIQQIVGQLAEVRKIVHTPIDVPKGARPFSQIIKSTSMLENLMLSAFGSINSGLQKVGKTGKVDIQMKGSIEDLNNIISHLEMLQKEIKQTVDHAKKTGVELPTSFHIVARSVSEMSSSVHSALDVFKKIPTSANVSEKELKGLSDEVYKSASALKKFDQIDLRTFSDQMGYALTNAIHKVRQFSSELKIPKDMRLGELKIDELVKTGDSDKIIQNWRKMQKQGGDAWKQMVVMLEALEPEFKSIFEKFAGKPRLLLKAFDAMTPQMKVLMSMFFDQMGHSTSAGFNEWLNSFSKYFSGMTKTNSRHLETFLGNTSKVMAAFKTEGKFVLPDLSKNADKSAEGMKRLGTALANLGIDMKELKALSGDLSWLEKWAKVLSFKVEWDFGPEKGKQMISLTGTFNMFGKALTLVGEGLEIFVTQLHRLSAEGGTEKTRQGIKQLVNMIRMLDVELGKTSKHKLALGTNLSESIKPLRDLGFALNNFFDGMEKIKNSAAFTLTEKEVKQFAIVVVQSMKQILTVFEPAIVAMSRFSESLGVKRFSMFAQGLRDLIVATKELHQLAQMFGEVAKSSDKGAGALTHFESVIQAMMVLLTKFPEIAGKLTFGVDEKIIQNMKMLVSIISPLSRAMKELESAFEKGTGVGTKITQFGENLKRLVNIIRGIDLDVVTHDIINDLYKLTKIFSSSMMELPAKQAAEQLNKLSSTVKSGTKSVAQNIEKGTAEIKNATKNVDKDFFADFGDLFEGGGVVPTMGIPDIGAPMSHLSSVGSEVTGVLQLMKGALDKLSKEFVNILPEEEKFFKGLQKLIAINPAGAISALSRKLSMLDQKLGEEGLRKSQDAIQRFIVELINGSDAIKSLGSSKIELEKIHLELDKGASSAKQLIQAMSKIQGVVQGAEQESAKLDLQNRLLKTRGEAKSVHVEMKSLLTTMKQMGPELKKSLSTSDARREFFSYIQEMQAKLHTAMTPMRAYVGFKGVNEEIQQMSRSIVQMKDQSKGLLTLADRFTGKLRTAGDQFLNLVAYQTRWYVSQQIFFMGLGQVERILSNFGELDKQVRRVLRVLRDSNFAVLGVESSVRALAGAGNKLAKEWSKNMEVMFKSQIQNTFYNLFKELGATAEEIGESLYQLGDAGLNVNEVISAIEPTLRMVIATEGEARETTKLVAGIFNLYGDSIEGARSNTEKFIHITDVLTAVFRDHMLEINELVSGMGYVIATAKLSGMKFEEVSAALGILNDNMLKGSKAGRAFNRMLLNSTRKLDETKKVLQIIATQVGDVDLTEMFVGLEKAGARPFDYIIQTGIMLHEKLRASSLTVGSLTEMFQTMGVVGARAFAILLLKAKDYERTLFQLQYAAFSAGEDMSKLLVGSFERSMHKIEGFTRAGYARMSGMVKGIVKMLAQNAEYAESKLRRLSDLSIMPDIGDIKSFMTFFSLLMTAQAVLLGLGKKGLPGLNLFKFDKLLGSLSKVVINTKIADVAFKAFNSTLKNSAISAYSLSNVYEKMSDKLINTSGSISNFSLITKSLGNNLSALNNKQKFVVSGLVDIEKAFTKVVQGKWNVRELNHFMDSMKQLKEFTPTFAVREQEFKIRVDMSKLISDLQRGKVSVEEFNARLASIQKKTIEVSGVTKLIKNLNILENEFKEGAIKIDEYRNRLRLLSVEASSIGAVKVLGLDRFSEKSYVSAFSGIRKSSKLLETNFSQMSKIGIKDIDDVYKLIRDPESWDAFNNNMLKSYSSWDRRTQQTSNKFMKLMDSMAEIKTPIRKAMIESHKLEDDLVNRAKRISASGAIIGGFWSGFSGGAASKIIPFFKDFRNMIFNTTKGLVKFGDAFTGAVARENAIINLQAGFAKLGTTIRGAIFAIGRLGSSIMSMFIYTFIFQKVFEIIEKITRGTEYWASQIGRVNSEFNKTTSSLTGNITGIVNYANKLDEIRKSLDVKMKTGIKIDSEGVINVTQEMTQLKLLLEGNQELSDFVFNVEFGGVIGAAKSWERLNRSIKKVVEETSVKAISRFVELGGEYGRAVEVYMKTIETATQGSALEKLMGGFKRKVTLKLTAEDWGSVDRVKFKRQGMEAAKLILDAAKTTLQFGAKTFEFQWDTGEIGEITSQLDLIADSVSNINVSAADSDKLFANFIFSLRKNMQSSKILEQFEKLSESINKVFMVEGAEEFQTFMDLFPTLAEKSKDEIQELAKTWAFLGKDKRAILLMRAAYKDLFLFNKEMKKTSSANMLRSAKSTEKFVAKAIDDISKLNITIEQLGGVAASQFEHEWDRSWSSWLEKGVSATIDVENALAGTFEFGALSNLGKIERAIHNTTKPIVSGFVKAYTEIGDTWNVEIGKMFHKSKLPKLFEPWRNELTIALQSPWATVQAAQKEWRFSIDDAIASATQRFNLLQESLTNMGRLATKEWRRFNKQSSQSIKDFGTEKDGKDSVREFSEGVKKSLKNAIKTGQKEAKELAKAMSKDVGDAINKSIQRLTKLNEVIAKAQNLSIKVKKAINEWAKGFKLNNKLMEVSLEYLRKFSESSNISKFVQEIEFGSLRKAIDEAAETFKRASEIGGTYEDKLKSTEKYSSDIISSNEKITNALIKMVSKVIEKNSKAELDAIEKNYKEKVKEEKEWYDNKKKSSDVIKKSNDEENRLNEKRVARRKSAHEDRLKELEKEKKAELEWRTTVGGEVSIGLQDLIKRLGKIKTGKENISEIERALRQFSPEVAQEAKPLFNMLANNQTKLQEAYDKSLEIGKQAQEQQEEVRKSVQSLIELKKNFDQYAKTTIEQGKVIAEILRRGGVSEAIQALSALGLDIKLEDLNVSSESFGVLNKAMNQLSFAADTLQKIIQPSFERKVKPETKPETKPGVVSEIAKNFKTVLESLTTGDLSAQTQFLAAEFVNLTNKMFLSEQTQKETDASLKIVNDAFIDLKDKIAKAETATTDTEQLIAVTEIETQLDELEKILSLYNAKFKEIDFDKVAMLKSVEETFSAIQSMGSRITPKIQTEKDALSEAVDLFKQQLQSGELEKNTIEYSIAVASIKNSLDDLNNILEIYGVQTKKIDFSEVDVNQVIEELNAKIEKTETDVVLDKISNSGKSTIDAMGKLQTAVISFGEDIVKVSAYMKSAYESAPLLKMVGKELPKEKRVLEVAAGKPMDIKVLRVKDGDTIVAENIDGAQFNIRTGYIDAPEMSQVGGVESKKGMEDLINEYQNTGYQIQAAIRESDEYGRAVAILTAIKDGQTVDLNQLAVLKGISQVATEIIPNLKGSEEPYIENLLATQKIAEENLAGLHGFTSWLNSKFKNISITKPSEYREDLSKATREGNLIAIQTILKNEASLKQLFNEFLIAQGKAPVYGEKELSITADNIANLYKHATTAGSIYTHDLATENLLNKIITEEPVEKSSGIEDLSNKLLSSFENAITKFNATDIGLVGARALVSADIKAAKEQITIVADNITNLYKHATTAGSIYTYDASLESMLKQAIVELNSIYFELEQKINADSTNQTILEINQFLVSFNEALSLSAISFNEALSLSTEAFDKTLSSSSDSLKTAFSSLKTAANNARSALASIKRAGARSGTILPGYGGGDHIPYDLEPGEAVINKEAVRMFGRDLFQAYNTGKASSIGRPIIGQKLKGVRTFIEKKVLPDDSPVRKFDINLGGIPFEGLATEDMINQLQRGLKRKQLVGQNR